MTLTPQAMADKGEAIYDENFRREYEQKYPGKFVAIDIITKEAFIADTPEATLEVAKKKNPNNYFHLIKIGSPGVYRVGYTNRKHRDWLFR